MIYNITIFEDIGDSVIHAFRLICGFLAELIYTIIIYTYNLFTYLSSLNIISDNDFFAGIYKNVGLILSLFMIFKLIFSLIQALVDPQKLNDKKSGYTSILIRMVISLVLLGLTPRIFNEAFKLQNLLIGNGSNSENVIYKLIVGDDNVIDNTSFGKIISTELYFSFYRDDEAPFLNEVIDSSYTGKYYDKTITKIEDQIRLGEDMYGRKYGFNNATKYLNLKDDDGNYMIEYNGLLSVLVGGLVLYILIMYTIQISVRIFQLAYLQLIAPIPILSYISDPDGAFKNWINQCVSTFLDLFLRLAIIYFVLYFANYIIEYF